VLAARNKFGVGVVLAEEARVLRFTRLVVHVANVVVYASRVISLRAISESAHFGAASSVVPSTAGKMLSSSTKTINPDAVFARAWLPLVRSPVAVGAVAQVCFRAPARGEVRRELELMRTV
jgi:hypothetical protein